MPEGEKSAPEEEISNGTSSLDGIDFSRGKELTEEDVEALNLDDVNYFRDISGGSTPTGRHEDDSENMREAKEWSDKRNTEAGINEGDSEKLRTAKLIARNKNR